MMTTQAISPQTQPDSHSTRLDRALWASVGLALATALVYAFIELDIVPMGNLMPAEYPAGIGYFVAACYAAGGLLILLRKRWLWIAGALINAFVIAVFVGAYYARPEVMFSAAGLLTKSLQILLEVGLIYLIALDSSKDSNP